MVRSRNNRNEDLRVKIQPDKERNQSQSDPDTDSDGSAYMPNVFVRTAKRPPKIPSTPRRRSLLSRMYGRLRQYFRSSTTATDTHREKLLEKLKMIPGNISPKVRKKRYSGYELVRKANNLGFERQSCELIDSSAQTQGNDQIDRRRSSDYLTTPLRPPTSFEDEHENVDQSVSEKPETPPPHDIQDKEIQKILTERPPLPPSAKRRERFLTVGFSKPNPTRSQFKLSATDALATNPNPPLDHSSSLGTLQDVYNKYNNLDSDSSDTTTARIEDGSESLGRIGRPHMSNGTRPRSRATSPTSYYSGNPHIIPTTEPGSYRENFHRQMKLARSVCNGVTPIPAEQMINVLRLEQPSDDENENKQKHEFEDGDSVYDKILDVPDGDGDAEVVQNVVDLEQDSAVMVLRWGRVGVMYIPFNERLPMRTAGPSYPLFDKTINVKRIEGKHIRAKLNRLRASEIRTTAIKFNAERWDKRRIVGMYKKRLRQENNFQSMKIVGDLDTHFHHINWFANGKDSSNYVGRYFDMEENRLVAIKIFGYGLSRNESERLQNKISAMTEITTLVHIECTNVVQLLAYFELNSRIHLVMEACDHSLRSELEKAVKGVHQKMAQGVIRQIVMGLEFCHNVGCLHCNICPDNILVSSDGVVKLADFKRAMFLTGEEKQSCPAPGTIGYGAPELLLRSSEFGLAADIWSLGCLLGELLRGIPLWNCHTDAEQIFEIQRTFGATIHKKPNVITYTSTVRKGTRSLRGMFPRISEDAVSFMSKCLELDPKKRSTCEGLLQHNFLKYNREGVEVQPVKSSMAEGILPRTEHTWNLRPHSAPTSVPATARSDNAICASSHNLCWKTPASPACLQVDYQVEELAHDDKPRQELKRKKSQTVVKTKTETHSDTNTESPSSEWHELSKHLGYASIHMQEALQHSSYDSASDSSCHVPSILKKGDIAGRKAQRKKVSKVSFAEDSHARQVPSSCLCAAQSQGENPKKIKGPPRTPRAMMRNLITSVRSSTWETVEVFTSQLKSIQKMSPKVFTSQVGTFVAALLDQIAASRSKVAGPSIRILRTIYDFAPKLLEQEIERIIPCMLAKLGGPLFIDAECCDILLQIVIYTNPVRACTALVKAGANQKLGVGRAASGKYLCEAMRRLSFTEDIGDETSTQRRLTAHLFDTATRFTRDSHNNTRDMGKEIFRLLLPHPHFWRIYLSNVQEEHRLRVNPLLDEIRKVNPTLDEIRRKGRP